MRLIGKTNIDFQGKRHFWMALSGIIILVSLVNVVLRGGLNYSIDFTGGLALSLRIIPPAGQQALEEEVIRKHLDLIGYKDSEVKTSQSAAGEDLLIRIKEMTRIQTPEALIRAKLVELHPDKWEVVPNDQISSEIADSLHGVSFVAIATSLPEDQLRSALQSVAIDNGQVIAAKTEAGKNAWLLAGEGRDPISKLRRTLRQEYPGYVFDFRSIEVVGPRIGSELRTQAVLAAIASWGLIILYLWWRYDLVFGVAAVIALIHDTLITIGIMSFFGYEFSMTVLAAILTLIGFSVNDTVVVYDPIRENIRRTRDKSLKEVINDSINQTLSRTIITSGTVFLVVAVLFLNGGEVLRGFSFAMLIGIVVGTYSSIYIASPILIDYVEKTGHQFTKKIRGK